jgi:protein tyrosine phosphatase
MSDDVAPADAHSNMETPFHRTYWVVPGKLLAGLYPGSRDHAVTRMKVKGLLDCDIRAVVNFMEPNEQDREGNPFDPYEAILEEMAAQMGTEIRLFRFPIKDLSVTTQASMVSILDAIDHCVSGGLPLYLHCWGGRGRTGTVVGCFLIRHGLANKDNVLEEISRLRSHGTSMVGASPETEEQKAMVLGWEAGF